MGANLMNQLDALPWSLRPSGVHALNFLCWRSKISFEIWLIPSHPQDPSGGIIFERKLLTEAQNRKNHLVMSLGPSSRPSLGSEIGFQRPVMAL